MSDNVGKIHLEPGEIVNGRNDQYVLQDELGEGGFGTVFRAKGNSREVALKIVKLWKVMPNDRQLYATKLQQEFEISNRISSAYIVKAFDFALHQGNPFIVMELCEGGTMRETIANPSQEFGLRLAIDILKGLSGLHQEGVIHRDIKPENILLTSQKRAKLVDFGICASIRKRHTQPNILGYVKEVFATITYSPPEQTDEKIAFKSVAPTNDIYAFGVTMFEYFTAGLLPFGTFEQFQGDFKAYDNKKKKNQWDRRTLEKAAGNMWSEIIEKCLKPNPKDRYQHAQEIINIIDKNSDEKSRVRSQYIHVNPNQQWVLKIMQGDEINRDYNISLISRHLNKNQLTIGWYNVDNPFLNDIGITENLTKYISSYHSTLIHNVNTNNWLIRDGQKRTIDGHEQWILSKNGVYVNSEKVGEEPYLILPDDIITLGDTTFKVILKY